MRINSNIYFEDFGVRCFGEGTAEPFVTIDMTGAGANDAAIFLRTPGECRKLREAADRAEALLSGGTDAP